MNETQIFLMPDDALVLFFAQDDDDVLMINDDDHALVPAGFEFGIADAVQGAVVEQAVALVPESVRTVARGVFNVIAREARSRLPGLIKEFKEKIRELVARDEDLTEPSRKRQNTGQKKAGPEEKLDPLEVMRILSDLFPTGMSVKVSGGHTVPRDSAQTVLPMQQHIKCVAKFQKHDIGHGSLGVTENYAILGAFNPFHVMNSEVVTRTPAGGHLTDFLHEASSHFLVDTNESPAVTRVRQWDAPQIMRLHKAEAIYDRYKVIACKVVVLFTNVDTTNTIKVWGRFFHQADHRVGPAFAADTYAWPADAESLRNLKLVTLGSDVYNSTSRIAVDRLDSTPGMQVLTLGPNSANGPPNQAAMMFEIPCREIAQSLSSVQHYHVPTTSPTHESDDPRPWDTYRIEDTTVLHDNFQQPMIYFWGAETDDGSGNTANGQIKPVFGGDDGGSNLYVEGTAEYSVHLFEARNPAAIGKADDMS